jgi:formylglycine-generating enzyme required for sulfatase activity
VLSELHIARDQGKTIIPFWIAGDIWSNVMPLGFILMQGIDARGNLLGAALHQVLKQLGQLSPPSQQKPQSAVISIPPRLAQFGFVDRIIDNIELIIPPLIEISAGPFLMGSDKQKDSQVYDSELQQHTVTLGAYYIAQFPLTVAEYACFVRATKHREPSNWQEQQTDRSDHPVVYISWNDALAYVRWFATIIEQTYRLPSEAEWEKAARSTDGRIYPWGNQWDKTRANTYEGGLGTTTPIGSYLQGASPYGVLDICGNVWEWTSTIYKPYPYNSIDGRENVHSKFDRVLRGGSWGNYSRDARVACRNFFGSPDVGGGAGVRLACNLTNNLI